MSDICAGCSCKLEGDGVRGDGTPCEQCDAPLCDKCANDGTLGDDSCPSIYCPKCLLKVGNEVAWMLPGVGG